MESHLVEAEEQDNADDAKALFFLGRRLERLLFGGIALIALTAFVVSLSTINKQILEDHSASGVLTLLDKIQSSEEHLTTLFNVKPDPLPKARVAPALSPPPPPPSQADPERLKALAETRRNLGLPPSRPPAPPHKPPAVVRSVEPPPVKAETYHDAIQKIIDSTAKETNTSLGDIQKYVDMRKPPLEIIGLLRNERATIESRPTNLWGIQTPRSLRLKYAEQDFNVSYGILYGILAAPLGILIIGWLAAVYMTRQRELVLIASITDYKRAFPHLLNFLPVHLDRFVPSLLQANQSAIAKRGTRSLVRFVQASVRTCVVLLLVLPMILGFTYSIYLGWQVDGEPLSGTYYVAAFAVLIMAMQTLALVIQEWILLRGKNFDA